MRRAGIIALTLVVFVVRLMAGALALPMPTLAPEGFSFIPICTAEGVKWHLGDFAPQPEPAKSGSDCPLCALCMATHGLSALVPTVLPLIPVEMTFAGSSIFHSIAPTLRIAARPPPSRAPPLLAG